MAYDTSKLTTLGQLEKAAQAAKDRADGKLSAEFLEALPTATFTNDFSTDIGFVAQTRCTRAIVTDDDGESYAEITTGTNAANLYAYAYYDLSDILASNTTSATIEFDALIPEVSRGKISLIDVSARTDSSGSVVPGSSSKDSYDSTGIAFRFGEYNSGYALLQSSTPTCTFGSWMHFKYVIDTSERTIAYTITDRDSSSILFTGSSEFFNDEASTVSGIEIYSYINDTTIDFDNLDITANYDTNETTLYIIGNDTDGYTLYMYKDSEATEIATTQPKTVYSTTPVQVGTWMDGTPVWRQAFETTFTEAGYELGDGVVTFTPSVTDNNEAFMINGNAWIRLHETPCMVDDQHADWDGEYGYFTIPSNLLSILENDVSGAYGWLEFVTSESNISA